MGFGLAARSASDVVCQQNQQAASPNPMPSCRSNILSTSSRTPFFLFRNVATPLRGPLQIRDFEIPSGIPKLPPLFTNDQALIPVLVTFALKPVL